MVRRLTSQRSARARALGKRSDWMAMINSSRRGSWARAEDDDGPPPPAFLDRDSFGSNDMAMTVRQEEDRDTQQESPSLNLRHRNRAGELRPGYARCASTGPGDAAESDDVGQSGQSAQRPSF